MSDDELPPRPFHEICAQNAKACRPASFGGYDLVSLEDWMSQRNYRRLTFELDARGRWRVVLQRGAEDLIEATNVSAFHDPLASELCAALGAAIEVAERRDGTPKTEERFTVTNYTGGISTQTVDAVVTAPHRTGSA